MKIYIRLLKYIQPYIFTLFAAIFCMVIFALTNGLMAYLIGPVMKFLFASGVSEEIRFIPFDLLSIPREHMVVAVPLIIFAVALVKGISYFGQSYLMGHVGQRVVADIRTKLCRHIMDLPVTYFSNTTTGTLISRVTNDTDMLQNTTVDSLATLLREGLTIFVLAAVVISSDWKLSIVAFIAFPIAIYPMMRFGKKMKRVSTERQVTMGRMTGLLHEAISGIRVVKAFCMEMYESMRLRDENERYARLRLKAIKVRSISSPMMELLGVAGFALTIWYAAYRIQSGELRPEAFLSFFASILMLYRPIKALNGVNLNILQGVAAAERVFQVMDTPGEEEKREGAIEIQGVNEGIDFKDLSFKYGKEWILKGVNLEVKKGEVIAIVGASGAGKTTLVNLIPRFYEVTGGAILIDGVDIRDMTIQSLRCQIAVVSQQVILFNDTIGRNISYGDFGKNEEDVIVAARAANAHGFIEKLADGYDTLIGEGGFRLSGGERQRISIARAIYKNSPLLILDEATSSLDTESEFEVQKGLNNLLQGRTAFVIAHRLSTIRNADRIVVLAEGVVKEIGKHDELLALGGEYSRLYSMQFGSSICNDNVLK